MLDTNILVYARNPASPFHEWAVNQIASLVESEGAAFSAAGLAELCSDDAVDPTHVLPEVASFGIQLLDFPIAATVRCGEAYRAYRSNRKRHSGKESPKIPLPDFFIGAHAGLLGLDLVTNDPDRFRNYFPLVRLVTP